MTLARRVNLSLPIKSAQLIGNGFLKFKIHLAKNYLLSLVDGINFHCDFSFFISSRFSAFLFIYGITRLLKSLHVEGDNVSCFFNHSWFRTQRFIKGQQL